MSGNVWEWCLTQYRSEKRKEYPLPYKADDGREEIKGSNNVWRVLRGGGFGDYLNDCRVVLRGGDVPHYGGNDFGFRVVEHLSVSGF
jgi:formylglycine-generating enzyme required for sulfatase activity